MLKTLKKLIAFFPARERRTGGAIIAAMFVAALLEMAGIGALIAAAGFFLRRGADARQIVAVLAAVVVILAGKNLFSCWIVRVQAKFVYHRQTQWSETLFARYLGGDYREITGRGGTRCALLLSRISLICEKVLLPAMQCAADFFVAAVLGVALGVYMFWPALAGIAFFLPAGILIYAVFRKKNRELGAEESAERLAAGKLAAESLDGVEIIRPMRREAFFAARYRKMQEIIGALDVRLYTWGQMPRLALESAAMIYLLALFGVMLLLNVPRATILLDFAALAAVMSRFLPACSRIHYNLTQIRQHQKIAEDFCRDMAHFAEPDFAAGADFSGFDGAVELRDITFRYGKDAAVLENFHLAVRSKECVGITGRTGCGKSTVFALILGFVSPEKGCVLAGGADLKDRRNGFLRQIGFVPQKNILFEDTVRGNLTLGENIPDEKLHAALKMAHLDDFICRFPGGLDGRIEPGGNNLSGGQKQRLAIARALCRDGVKLLLLDEPTSALDAMTENEFAETLGSLRGKITMLVISHREAALRGCDRVISLDS